MRLILFTILALLIMAVPASAARFQHNGADIDFTASSFDTVRITATGSDAPDPRRLTFTGGAGGSRFTVGTGCTILSNVVRCDAADDTRLRFTTNDRADVIDATRTDTPNDASVPQIFDTRGGDDVLTAGPLADEVRAGDGIDTITGGPGADSLLGEAGDDRFIGLTAGDVVDGGDGADTIDLSGEVVGMTITLDGDADDGPPGGRANVRGVETVIGTIGNDIITGGAVTERLAGGGGADRIDARDGGADSVNCGESAGDVAIVDAADSVTGCETVQLPSQGTPAPVAPLAPPAVLDADGDGVVTGVDCDDTRAAVRPGVRDVPGNRVDEDCSGRDARFARVDGRLSFDFSAFPNGRTRVDRLTVRELQAGGRAEVRCSGPCSFRKKVGKARNGKVNLKRLIRGRLRTGATLEVRLTAPETIGRVFRFKMRKLARPKRTDLCLPPGGKVGRCA